MRAALVCSATFVVFGLAEADASPFRVPDTAAADAWEVKLAGVYESGDGADARALPLFDVTAPMIPGVETSVTFGWGRAETPAGVREGFLDLVWAAKIELARQDDGAWGSLAIEPALTAPIGSRGLSQDTWSVALPLTVSRSIGPLELRAAAAVTYALDDSDSAEWGLLATRSLGDDITLGAEIGATLAFSRGQADERFLGLGAIWALAPGFELQVRIGAKKIDNTPPAKNVALFLQRTF